MNLRAHYWAIGFNLDTAEHIALFCDAALTDQTRSQFCQNLKFGIHEACWLFVYGIPGMDGPAIKQTSSIDAAVASLLEHDVHTAPQRPGLSPPPACHRLWQPIQAALPT